MHVFFVCSVSGCTAESGFFLAGCAAEEGRAWLLDGWLRALE